MPYSWEGNRRSGSHWQCIIHQGALRRRDGHLGCTFKWYGTLYYTSIRSIDGTGGIMFLGCLSVCACMRLCARAEAFSADLPLTYVHPTRFRSVEEENRQFIYNTDPRHCLPLHCSWAVQAGRLILVVDKNMDGRYVFLNFSFVLCKLSDTVVCICTKQVICVIPR